MDLIVIFITVLVFIGGVLISFKAFNTTNKELLELSRNNLEVRYGLFYNSLVEDDRSFTLGEIVWFYNQKYYIVKYETNHSAFHLGSKLLHLSKTMNDVTYKEDGLVVDSREVKKIVRFDK